MALGYVWRFDTIPTLRFAPILDPPTNPTAINVNVTAEYQRVHMIVFDLEAALGKLRVAAEALVALTEDLHDEDPASPNPYLSAVVSLDYRTAQFFGNHRLHLFVDGLINQALVGGLDIGPLTTVRFPWQYAALGRVRYELGENLRFDCNLVSSLNSYDLMLNPAVEYNLFDRGTVQAGAAILLGERDQGFFGPFRDNSRFTLRVELNF